MRPAAQPSVFRSSRDMKISEKGNEVTLLQVQHQGQRELALLPPGWEEFRRVVSILQVSDRRVARLHTVDSRHVLLDSVYCIF